VPNRTRPPRRSPRYLPRPRSWSASDAEARITTTDVEATKRMLLHIMSFLELLTADVQALMTALDKGPGEASSLAVKLLDDPEDWRY